MRAVLIALALGAAAGPEDGREAAGRCASGPSPAPADRALAGVYELRGVGETGSAIELRPDGRFDYFLSYGALDEAASGWWRAGPDGVALCGDRALAPPSFAPVEARREGAGGLRVLVEDRAGRPVERIDVELLFDRGEPVAGTTGRDGFALPGEEAGRRVTGVRLGIGMYAVASEVFPVDAARADRLRFRFEPNDLGRVDLSRFPVRAEAGALVMERNGATLRYERVGR